MVGEATWLRENAGEPVSDVDIVRSQTLKGTLIPQETSHVVLARAGASQGKMSLDVLMVFREWLPEEGRTSPVLSPILVCDDHMVSYEVVNLGAKSDRYALRVKTEGFGNGPHPVVNSLYLWAEPPHGWWELRQVFCEMTSFIVPEWGDARWSMDRVQYCDRGRALKDIVLTTHVEKWHGHPDWDLWANGKHTPGYYKVLDGTRVSVFRWNGDHYVGKMNVGK